MRAIDRCAEEAPTDYVSEGQGDHTGEQTGNERFDRRSEVVHQAFHGGILSRLAGRRAQKPGSASCHFEMRAL